MPDLPEDMTLERLRDWAVAAHPELASCAMTILADGWDTIALDADDRIILKFPRHALGEAGMRREAAVLDVVDPAVDMPVPLLKLYETPAMHSMHAKLPGGSLPPETYRDLTEEARARLGDELGVFYAQLHAIDSVCFRALGVGPAEPWLDAASIRERAFLLLPAELHRWADRALGAWADLPPDPHGEVFGHFDGHGWNMAFDRKTQRLGGLFDFGDSGFGPLHREFVYSTLVSSDLTRRIADSYEKHSGRQLDRNRILLLADIHRLWELAVDAEDADSVAYSLKTAAEWVAERS